MTSLEKYRKIAQKVPFELYSASQLNYNVKSVSEEEALAIIKCWHTNLTLPECKARQVFTKEKLERLKVREQSPNGIIRWVGGQDDPLSNFWIAPVEYRQATWPSRECAMMGQKLTSCGVIAEVRQFLGILQAEDLDAPIFGALQNGLFFKQGWCPRIYLKSGQMKRWVTEVISRVLRTESIRERELRKWYSTERFETAREVIWSAALTDEQLLNEILRPEYCEFRHFTSVSHTSQNEPRDHFNPWLYNSLRPHEKMYNQHGKILTEIRHRLVKMASRIWDYIQNPYYDCAHPESPRLYLGEAFLPRAAQSLRTKHYVPDPRVKKKEVVKAPSRKVSAPTCLDYRVKAGLIPDPSGSDVVMEQITPVPESVETMSVTPVITHGKREMPEEFHSVDSGRKRSSPEPAEITLVKTAGVPSDPPGQEEGSISGTAKGSVSRSNPKGLVKQSKTAVKARVTEETSVSESEMIVEYQQSTASAPQLAGRSEPTSNLMMAGHQGEVFLLKREEGVEKRRCPVCKDTPGGGLEKHVYQHVPWFVPRTMCCPKCQLGYHQRNRFLGHFGTKERKSPCRNSEENLGKPPVLGRGFDLRWCGLIIHFLRQLALTCVKVELFILELGKDPLQLLLAWVRMQAIHWENSLGRFRPGKEFVSSVNVLRQYFSLPEKDEDEIKQMLGELEDICCLIHPRVLTQVLYALFCVAEGEVLINMLEPSCMALGVATSGKIKICEHALKYTKGIDCHFHPARQEVTAGLASRPGFTGRGVDGERGIIEVERAVGCLDRGEAWRLLDNRRTLELFKDSRFNVLQIGAHPTLGERWQRGPDEREQIIQGFMDAVKKARENQLLSAIGEIGLDYFHGRKDPEKDYSAASRDMLQYILREVASKETVPLVFHIRESFVPESVESSASDDVLALCLSSYNGGRLIPRDRAIYLHSWNGSERQLASWVANFNEVYVGLSSLLQKGDQAPCRHPYKFQQRKWCSLKHPELEHCIRLMDPSMYVLETDAGYQRPWFMAGDEKVEDHSCHAIWEVAQIVGRLRGEDPKMVVLQARINARRLWSLRA